MIQHVTLSRAYKRRNWRYYYASIDTHPVKLMIRRPVDRARKRHLWRVVAYKDGQKLITLRENLTLRQARDFVREAFQDIDRYLPGSIVDEVKNRSTFEALSQEWERIYSSLQAEYLPSVAHLSGEQMIFALMRANREHDENILLQAKQHFGEFFDQWMDVTRFKPEYNAA